METELIKVLRNEAFVNTRTVSEMLEVEHKDLLRTLENLLNHRKNNVPASLLKFPQKFIETTYKNKMGRHYKMYNLNEQAYMKLAMRLSGYDKAEKVQDSIIEAFSLMKNALLNKSNSIWLDARDKGKTLRLQETDTIKAFVDYATKQGSKSAFRYYSNITKMTNKALSFLVTAGVPLRDLADIETLGFIGVADTVARKTIEQGMIDELPYKFIYKQAKDKVNAFADSVNIISVKHLL